MASWLTCLACGSVDVDRESVSYESENGEACVRVRRFRCADCDNEERVAGSPVFRSVGDSLDRFAYLTARGVKLLQANLADDADESDGWEDVREHASVSSDDDNRQRFSGYFGG